jgi:23S rRNA (pseudouridine1915-N3)-methyltransferase
MQIELWCIGKDQFDFVKKGIQEFSTRLKHYTSFKLVYINDVKRSSKESAGSIKDKEGEVILKKLKGNELLILLDENGKEMDSVKFSSFIENKMIYSSKKIVFLIGGAFGFSNKVYEIADEKLSFSKMTFSHQLIRLCFVEQLYRAFTIIKNEKYHNS